MEFPDHQGTIFAIWLRLTESTLVFCAQLKEFEAAESALEEANAINNREPEVWAYLSLICLHTGRRLAAEQSFKYAIKVHTHLLLIAYIYSTVLSIYVPNLF